MNLGTRNATLADMAELLQEQHARKLDLVVPAVKLRSTDGLLVVDGAEPLITDEGVTSADGVYRPTAICDEGIADKLGVPIGYLRRMRETRPDLLDANVNGWLHGKGEEQTTTFVNGQPQQGPIVPEVPADPRSFLLRCFRGDDGGEGVARALLSDKYSIVDNLDVLTAALEGVRDAGVATDIVGCDLTDRKMYVRIAAPEIAALAPVLLAGYRSPFDQGVARAGGIGGAQPGGAASPYVQHVRDLAASEGMGYEPGQEPIVFAGIEISNSETGGGAFQIVPRLVVQLCKNGLKITADALRAVHLGGRLDEGVIRWTADTQGKALALVTAQARDAVATFLDVDYVTMAIDRIENKAATPITRDADAVVTTVCKTLKYGEDRTKGVLDHFIRGGQMTAGGVLNAVTSYAQTLGNADDAAEMEGSAMRALDAAVRCAA